MFINPPDDQFDHLFDMGYEPFIVNKGFSTEPSTIGESGIQMLIRRLTREIQKRFGQLRNRPDTARRENIRKLERTGRVEDGSLLTCKHYLCYTKFGGEVQQPGGGWRRKSCGHVSRLNASLKSNTSPGYAIGHVRITTT